MQTENGELTHHAMVQSSQVTKISRAFDQTTMEEIIQSYHYKMDTLSKIQKGGTSDTYNGRKQEDRRTELRKLGEALQHLQNKRCRFEL